MGWAKATKILNEKGNTIGNEGAIAIASALHINQTLQTLDISFNRIEVESAKAFANGIF